MASDARSRRLAEFLGLLSFGVSLMLLISLGTYSPTDPAPFFKAGTTGPARNFIGPIGAFLAELLVPQLFGFAALLLPLVLGWVGWSLFWCRSFDAPYTKGAGLLMLLLSTTALLAMAVGTVTFGGEPLRDTPAHHDRVGTSWSRVSTGGAGDRANSALASALTLTLMTWSV